ncbi:MAG: DUF1513 domain-containing protein [Pseudomonadota bacterium]
MSAFGCRPIRRQYPSTVFSAAKDADGYAIYGLYSETLAFRFKLSCEQRMHGFARRPQSDDVVCFARRPGEMAVVFDGESGSQRNLIESASNRLFYGHGAYSADGRYLYASENAYQTGHGVIGIYDADAGYSRVGEFESGGIGPHEIILSADGRQLVVANGGVRTHPSSGRKKLNLQTMESNITWIDLSTEVPVRTERLPGDHRQLSIRHIDINRYGSLVFACQYYGDDGGTPQLFGREQNSGGLELTPLELSALSRLGNYCGSVVALNEEIAVTSPRGNHFAWTKSNRTQVALTRIGEVCGLFSTADHLIVSDGRGYVRRISRNHPSQFRQRKYDQVLWDNHLG